MVRVKIIKGSVIGGYEISFVDSWVEVTVKSQCPMKIRAAVQWDGRAIAEMVKVVNAYIMPFEIFQNEEDMKPHLEGLVLLPLLATRTVSAAWFV